MKKQTNLIVSFPKEKSVDKNEDAPGAADDGERKKKKKKNKNSWVPKEKQVKKARKGEWTL